MASKQSKFKRSFPFLLALVVLMSCLPVVPVSAANSMTLEGVWEIGDGWEQAYSDGHHSFFSISVDAYVFVDGQKQTVSSIFIDEREPDYVGISNSLWSERGFHDSGVHTVDDGRIYFNKVVTITDRGAIDFFTYYATQDTSHTYKLIVDGHEEHSHFSPWFGQSIVDSEGTTFECSQCSWTFVYTYSGEGVFNGFVDASGKKYFDQCIFNVSTAELRLTSTTTSSGGGSGSTESYTSTISIDGQEFTFTSTTEQPAVLLQVTSTGAIMSYGDQTKSYSYEGDGNFLGLGYSSFMDPSYLPGKSYPLSAGRHTLKSVNDGTGTGSGPFETTIVIDGSVFQFFSDTEYPLVTCYLSSNGVRLVCGEDVRMWRPKYNEEFLGLALSPNSSEPSYKLSDEWFMVRGSSTKYAFEYYSYCVESEENELAHIFKSLATTILVPVSVFFTAEFIPGLPIGSVMLISFVIGLLFFFLKSSK